jgi:hypothetical protein
VRDGGRIVRFTGTLLAKVTSERKRASRWTVIEIFRTSRGMYVVHRVGISHVYHTSDCAQAITNRLPYGHEIPGGPPDTSGLTACSTCNPLPADGDATLRFERDRHWAGVADTADAVVDMLHRTEAGSRSMPWISANLLSEASKTDADIARAYSTEIL